MRALAIFSHISTHKFCTNFFVYIPLRYSPGCTGNGKKSFKDTWQWLKIQKKIYIRHYKIIDNRKWHWRCDLVSGCRWIWKVRWSMFIWCRGAHQSWLWYEHIKSAYDSHSVRDADTTFVPCRFSISSVLPWYHISLRNVDVKNGDPTCQKWLWYEIIKRHVTTNLTIGSRFASERTIDDDGKWQFLLLLIHINK